MKFIFVLCCLHLTVILNGQQRAVFLKDYNTRWVDSVFTSLTLDQKIGQLLMPRGNYSGKPYHEKEIISWISKYHIGGIVWFAGNPSEQAVITNQLQSLSKIPLLIGEDFEWGLAMRLDSTVRFPYALALGAMDNQFDLIEKMGIEIGKQCQRLGVHINYAPVVDINNNPNNPVINFRSFGENKDYVAKAGLAYMKGLQSQHIIATAKHFPGHGDTDVDSHLELPVIRHDTKRLNEVELFPFKTLINQGLCGIMTAHLSIPSLDSTKNLASTLSPKIINGLLRNDLHFDGLVFTDAIEMKAINKYHPNGEAIVKALIAGNDIVETFMDVPMAVEAIKKAINDERLSIKEIDNKVLKILKAKSFVGLDRYKPIEIKHLNEELNPYSSHLLNQQLSEEFITLTHNNNQIIPISDLTKSIVVLSIDEPQITAFQKTVSLYTKVDYLNLPLNATPIEIEQIFNTLASYDIILVDAHMQEVRASKNYGLNESNKTSIGKLLNMPNVAIAFFGNAFGLQELPIPVGGIKCSFLIGYQSTEIIQQTAAQMMFGALAIKGHLPISVTDDFRFGMGIYSPASGRLSYGLPDQVKIDGQSLNTRIDSLINVGLDARAYPGAVVSVAKDGKVIFQKAYGFNSYEQDSSLSLMYNNTQSISGDVMDESISGKTSSETIPKIDSVYKQHSLSIDAIYDLASVTKVAASALALMQESSSGRFDVLQTLDSYLPNTKGSNKGNLVFKDMLTHRSGLKAWIPFWQNTIDTIATLHNAITVDPLLISQMLYKEKRRNFFQRLFGVKPKKIIDYTKTIKEKPILWTSVLKTNNVIWQKNIYTNKRSPDYEIKIVDGLFLNNNYSKSIYQSIIDSPVSTKHSYVYSDLHYYFYPEIFQNITGISWTNYLNKTYSSLGANTLTYNPSNTFPLEQIVPTEYDSTFRKMLIHGTVHDEGAAMLSGISGHAGLFGNANDVTKLMQLYLQKGYYGGKKYFDAEVIDRFTSYQFPEENNRRGLAFDKKELGKDVHNAPSLASDDAYGHSGFTGTYVWVDPKYHLVYVFLSNRVYPTRDNNKLGALNIRTDLGNIIYQEIIK